MLSSHVRIDLPEHAEGDTPLHRVIRNKTINEVFAYISIIDRDTLQEQLRTGNSRNELPIDLAHGKPSLQKVLLNALLDQKIKPLSDPVDIITDYAVVNEELENNLEIAALIANKTRSLIKYSSSHPEINTLSLSEKMDRHKKICAMRNQAFMPRFLHRLFHDPLNTLLHPHDTVIQSRADVVIQHQTANCGEMAYVAYALLKEMNRQLPAGIFSLHGGDHCFVKVGRPDNEVICDPWAGSVFPSQLLQQHLKDSTKFTINDNFYIVLAKFNPLFHRIEKVDTNSVKHYGVIGAVTIFMAMLLFSLKYLADCVSIENDYYEEFRMS